MNKTILVLLLVLLTTTVILCEAPAVTTPAKETPSTALAPVEAPAQTLEADTLKHHRHHGRRHHRRHARRHHRRHGRKHHRRHHRRHHHVRKVVVRRRPIRRHHHIRRHHVRRHHVRRHHIRRHRMHHKKHHVRRHHHIRRHHVKRHHVRRHHIHRKIHHIKPARKVFHVRHHHHHRKPVSRRQHKRLIRKIRRISHRVRKVQLKKSRKFAIVRKTIALPKMSKIQLHNSTPTYADTISGVPKNARALIVGVYYLHGNYPQGHGYLNFEMSQKGADANGVAKMTNYHHNWYFNSDYYEFMLPWSGKLTQEVIMKVQSSYNTGSYPNSGNQNYYKISVEGYLLH